MTKRWRIEVPEKAGPCVVEAPSFGLAVDYFLASHGMFGYDRITCEETDAEPDEPFAAVARIYPDYVDNPAKLAEMDAHHHQAEVRS